MGLQTVWQGRQPVGEAELPDRVADLVLGHVELSVPCVRGKGGVEQEPLLGHEHHPLPQRLKRNLTQVDAVEQHRPGGGVHQPGEQLGSVVFPDPVSPTIATRVSGSMCSEMSCSTGLPSGQANVMWSNSIDTAPSGSRVPVAPGSTTSAGVSRMPITRRHPAIAFWASVNTWVPICTGPTNRVTRNANANTLPGVMLSLI